MQGGETVHRRGGGGFMIAPAALLLYVFLLGPAARVYTACPRPTRKAIEFVYAPLEWLDERLPGRPFSRYVALWRP